MSVESVNSAAAIQDVLWRSALEAEARGGRLLRAPDWLPNRVVALTAESHPSRERVGVFCSRLGNDWERRRRFAAELRQLALRLQRRGAVAITARSSPNFPCIRRALARRGVACLAADAGAAGGWPKWRQRLQDVEQRLETAAVLSPCIEAPASTTPSSERAGALPLEDVVALALSDRVEVIYERPGGAISRLRRCAEAAGFEVRSAVAQSKPAVAAPLNLSFTPECIPPFTPVKTAPRSHATAVAVLQQPYLTHCTRAPRRCWTGETQKQYLDAILAGGSSRDALATLKRILDGGVIRSSSRGIRGNSPVVCLTELPLYRLATHRTYRRHRCRWDFEPYGVCVTRQTVAQQGGGPVVYGDEKAWKRLPRRHRPFFQIATSASETDWRHEQEWRLPSDRGLTIPREQPAFAFTRTDEEAAWLGARTDIAVIGLPTALRLSASL